MNIPDDIRKCVAFIGAKNNGKDIFLGSVFFIGKENEEGKSDNIYAVTARHVIDTIKRNNIHNVLIRINKTQGGTTWVETATSGWFTHPSDNSIDVAMHRLMIPSNYDHLVFPTQYFLTKEIIQNEEIGVGDEVVISGLFKHHIGDKRNIPIVRSGNIANFHEEKVPTKLFGEIDAHLIECRSIGGLSGSPVFVNLGLVRNIKNAPKFTTGKITLYLLGLIHGHFDSDASDVDTVFDTANGKENVNTGIAIVVPCEKILETLEFYEKAGLRL